MDKTLFLYWMLSFGLLFNKTGVTLPASNFSANPATDCALLYHTLRLLLVDVLFAIFVLQIIMTTQ